LNSYGGLTQQNKQVEQAMVTITADEEIAVWRDPRAIALLFAASLTVMANATISPALPGLERAFADDPNAELLTRLLVPAPSLSVALIAPLAGYAADRFGRRWLLLTGMLLFAISGSAGLFLPNLSTIFASRLVLGVAVAMIMTSQTALIGDYFLGERRDALMGLQISARNFGGFVFISLAGWLAVISARLPFAIYAGAALLVPFVYRVVNEPRRLKSAPISAGSSGGSARWALLTAVLALLQMITNMIFFLMPTQLPFFFEDLGYESATMTGSTLGILTIVGGGVALLYRRIKSSVGYSGTYALGYVLMAGGFALLAAGSGIVAILVAAAAIGAGYATVMPTFVAIVLQIAPDTRRGMAGGILTTSVFVGQILSPLASIPVIASFGYAGLFGGTAFALAAMALVAAIARVHRGRPRPG
jgi:MFS family permease